MSEMRATMKQNRAARKAMADSRAMEEQMERQNPLSGSGATPSMGLSQVRGGKKMMKNASAQGKQLMEHLASLHGSGYAKQFHEGMKGAGFFSNLGHGLSDVAGMFGLGKKQKKEESESDSDEEKEGGLHTGRYEGEGHCGGMAFSRDTQDFSGHMKGGFLGMMALALPLLSKLLGAGKMSQGAHDAMKKMIADHEKKHHSKMEGGFMGLAMMALPLISKLLGAGEMTKGAADQLKRMMKKGDMKGSGRVVGAGHCDGGRMGPVPYGRPQKPVMELMGDGKKVKRVVGAGDGRRKRAEVVRKVMAEKGMKMIEASKYVKEHGLYNP